MLNLNLRKPPIKQEIEEKARPLSNQNIGKFHAFCKDLVAVLQGLGGPEYYYVSSVKDGHLKCQAVFAPHQKGLICQVELIEGAKTKTISITIDTQNLGEYNYFEAKPIKLKNQQRV